MKISRILLAVFGLLGSSALFQSCIDNDDNSMSKRLPTAIVTVCPSEDGSFVMNLDNATMLRASNLTTSPFGKKEVRALVNYTEEIASEKRMALRSVHVNWIDSIRTKAPLAFSSETDDTYGNDPIEIIADWVTVAEDGYITLRVRTRWGYSHTPHTLNLLTGVNPENPYEMELRHNANGDLYGDYGDTLIAFNLNEMPDFKDTVKIKLRWNSFSGEKSTEFDLAMRTPSPEQMTDKSLCKRSFD